MNRPVNRIMTKSTRARVWDRFAALRTLNEGLVRPQTDDEKAVVEKLKQAQALCEEAIQRMNRILGVNS